MNAFITFDELREIGKKIDRRAILEKAADIQGKNVFLSHSSDDHDLVPGVIRILENHGARVYVDERDPELPTWKYLPTQVFAVAALSTISWLQAKRFSELSTSYSLAAHEIAIIAAMIGSIKVEEDFSRFVSDTENAFSRAHTRWVARRDI